MKVGEDIGDGIQRKPGLFISIMVYAFVIHMRFIPSLQEMDF